MAEMAPVLALVADARDEIHWAFSVVRAGAEDAAGSPAHAAWWACGADSVVRELGRGPRSRRAVGLAALDEKQPLEPGVHRP